MAQVNGVDTSGPSQFGQTFSVGHYGVWGDSHYDQGILATCDEGNGIYGYSFASDGAGIVGVNEQNVGVLGAGPAEGVYGSSQGGTGVVGTGDNAGVAAFNMHNNNAAYLAADCCAAWLMGQVHIDGAFTVSGWKSALVQHAEAIAVDCKSGWMKTFWEKPAPSLGKAIAISNATS